MEIEIYFLENINNLCYSFNLGFDEQVYSIIWLKEFNIIFAMQGYYSFDLTNKGFYFSSKGFKLLRVNKELSTSLDYLLLFKEDLDGCILNLLEKEL